MKNIFENAKFGDKFKTRDGRMALYLENAATYGKHQLAIDGLAEVFYLISCDDSGICKQNTDFDIVSRWNDIVVESVLNVVAEAECKRMMDTGVCYPDDVFEFYKAGYRKAKEEKK